MKFSLATIALAATAIASPTNNPPPASGSCNVKGDNKGKVVCCNSLIPVLGQILCSVAVGSGCTANQKTYCCKTTANGGVINVDLLNCVSLS
ncbi:hypothetical protein MY11210_004581 [Beauveria gryllotalpidicola]